MKKGNLNAFFREKCLTKNRFTAEDVVRGNGAVPETLNRCGCCRRNPVAYMDNDGRYYNRARLDKKNYYEGVWYFYEIDDISLGNMYEERELVGWKDIY